MSKLKLTATPILAVVALTFLPAAQGGGCSIGDIQDQAEDALNDDEDGDDDDDCPEGMEEVEICEGEGPMGEGPEGEGPEGEGPEAGPQGMGPPPGGEDDFGGEGCELVCVPEDELDEGYDDDDYDDDFEDDDDYEDDDGPDGEGPGGPPGN